MVDYSDFNKSKILIKEKAERLDRLEKHLRDNIIGQEIAVKRMFQVVSHGEFTITPQGRPRGSLLFLGPTGVGKTELTLLTSKFLLGDNKFFRFDMSEFMHFDSVKLFMGDERGSSGRLGDVLEHHDYGFLLFDEMEKANRLILDLFLQILDTATITLANGKRYDLSKFYIVLTSNVGSRKLSEKRSFSYHAAKDTVVRALKQENFRMEFLGRFGDDNIVIFRPLDKQTQARIANISLDRELERLQRSHGITLLYEPEGPVLQYIRRKGINVQFGARHLRNFVQEQVQAAIASKLRNVEDPSGYLMYDPHADSLFVESKHNAMSGANEPDIKLENEWAYA